MSFISDVSDSKNYSLYKRFYEFLLEENAKFNLTAITDEREFFIKNVQDSTAFSNVFANSAKVIEIGSGAGFPSVPLKAERNDLEFTLVEANEKKCGFLKSAADLLGFECFKIVCGRAEELSKDKRYRESFDHGVARAVAPLNVLAELLLPFIKVGGTAVCYKGINYKEELSVAENAVRLLGGRVKEVKEYALDEGFGERALVIIEKVKTTDEAYPRKFAKIKKCPL